MGENERGIPQGGRAARRRAARSRRAVFRRRGIVLATCAAAVMLTGGALAVGVPAASAASAARTTAAAESAARAWPDVSETRAQLYGDGRSAQQPATYADAAESSGIVLIETELGYRDAAAAGTGIVLSADGLILTNNHVIDNATEITVTIASTGETYTARLIGTDAEDDVALLQLEGASGLTTATIDDDAESLGDAVTAVGNAGGGGVLMAADGTITDLEATVTTASSGGSPGETLDGMIEFAADVVAGDSGGALRDAEGEVIGMTTAASSGRATTVAFAVPIEDALAIAQQILDGDESDGAVVGYPAFLGITLGQSRYGYGSTATGATISGVFAGTPAARAGLAAGDTIVAVDGARVADASALGRILAAHEPGDAVALTWVDSSGQARSGTVDLAEGPA